MSTGEVVDEFIAGVLYGLLNILLVSEYILYLSARKVTNKLKSLPGGHVELAK
jgi:hypothetical protein